MTDAAPSDAPLAAIVGAGAVGTVLARRLDQCGYAVAAILSRRVKAARALADRVGSAVASSTWSDLPPPVRLVFVCVPDDAIPEVARRLARIDHDWSQTVVAHASGALTAAALAPLAEAGAHVLSFHPLQTFTIETPPEAFEGVYVGVEGDAEAVAFGETLAQAIGARPLALTAEAKTRYHCAAALASNGLVALMAVVQEVLTTAGVDAEDGTALVRPLVERTWANLVEAAPEHVLTGPVARGDRGTIAAHLDALTGAAPHLVPLYVALTTEMTRVAVRGAKIAPEEADQLLDVLQRALVSSDG